MECSHCGATVTPTVHRREGQPAYEVGYYRLLTGKLQAMTMQNPRDPAETIEFYKLLEPRWVVTCPRCMARPEIQEELEELFSGIPEKKDASSGVSTLPPDRTD